MELDQLLTPDEVKDITRLSSQTLKRWRKKNIILQWVQIGKSIRYKASDVYQLLNTTGGTLS